MHKSTCLCVLLLYSRFYWQFIGTLKYNCKLFTAAVLVNRHLNENVLLVLRLYIHT